MGLRNSIGLSKGNEIFIIRHCYSLNRTYDRIPSVLYIYDIEEVANVLYIHVETLFLKIWICIPWYTGDAQMYYKCSMIGQGQF